MTLTQDMARAVRGYAKRDSVSKAAVFTRAMRALIEDEEDRYLSAVGDKIAENPGKLISSREFWKRVNKRRA